VDGTASINAVSSPKLNAKLDQSGWLMVEVPVSHPLPKTALGIYGAF